MADNLHRLGLHLEKICEKVLELNGYEILSGAADAGLAKIGGPDLIVKEPTEQQEVLVEVKLYRSLRVEASVLRNAAVPLNRFKLSRRSPSKTLLIVTAVLDEKSRSLLRNIGIDEVWDLETLAEKSALSKETSTSLENLLRDAGFASVGVKSPFSPYIENLEVASADTTLRGDQLIRDFEATSPGAADAKKFEQLCIEVIDYLFGNQLGRLKSQNRVEDGFQIMDLIARLEPKKTGAFWLALAQDFRCRYVVFEFKNYAAAISQNQIYSTEKYLYPNALRSVAIIIARNGHDKGAGRAIQGALRESGKVFVMLSLDDVYDLLRAKDRGDEPSDMMVDHLDALLTDIVP